MQVVLSPMAAKSLPEQEKLLKAQILKGTNENKVIVPLSWFNNANRTSNRAALFHYFQANLGQELTEITTIDYKQATTGQDVEAKAIEKTWFILTFTANITSAIKYS